MGMEIMKLSVYLSLVCSRQASHEKTNCAVRNRTQFHILTNTLADGRCSSTNRCIW